MTVVCALSAFCIALQAYLTEDGKRLLLAGRFNTAEEAAWARDIAAFKRNGGFRRLMLARLRGQTTARGFRGYTFQYKLAQHKAPPRTAGVAFAGDSTDDNDGDNDGPVQPPSSSSSSSRSSSEAAAAAAASSRAGSRRLTRTASYIGNGFKDYNSPQRLELEGAAGRTVAALTAAQYNGADSSDEREVEAEDDDGSDCDSGRLVQGIGNGTGSTAQSEIQYIGVRRKRLTRNSHNSNSSSGSYRWEVCFVFGPLALQLLCDKWLL